MSKTTERFERFTMFTSIILVNLFPLFMYVIPLGLSYYIPIAVFQLITGFLVLMYATLCLCYRGFVTKDDFENLVLDENAQNCSICMQFKPERAHHCSSCKRCIKKMDHHCHWLGRCINYNNHGHFIRFLGFMFLNSIPILGFNSYLAYQVLSKNAFDLTPAQMITLIISTLVAGLLFIVGGSHFGKQLNMLTKNITFLESLHCQHFGFLEDDSPYNINLRYNFEDVLGPMKYLFFGKPRGNGILFKKRYDVQYWPKHFKFSEKLYVEHL